MGLASAMSHLERSRKASRRNLPRREGWAKLADGIAPNPADRWNHPLQWQKGRTTKNEVRPFDNQPRTRLLAALLQLEPDADLDLVLVDLPASDVAALLHDFHPLHVAHGLPRPLHRGARRLVEAPRGGRPRPPPPAGRTRPPR